MGGCANSKYAVDEDKAPKEKKNNKKNKKDSSVEPVAPAAAAATDAPAVATEPVANGTTEHKPESPQLKEDIEFIDKEEAEKAAAAAAAATAAASGGSDSKSLPPDNDDTKKEVTTYQTTVVKQTHKEGDELLQHLKDEAFRTLQNLLKQQEAGKQTTRSTTASSSANSTPQTVTEMPNEDVSEQIKSQVVNSVGKAKQETIHSIIDTGIDMIKQNKVKNMTELQASLEQVFPDTGVDNNSELITKVINATTGFLTAKGTEAGALLSNILANSSKGLTGVMNETEKTTVKVTRTVTEQIMSGGQLKEVTRVITTTEPAPPGAQNIQDVLKNLQNGLSVDGSPYVTTTSTLVGKPTITVSSPTKIVSSGNTTSSSSTIVNEKHETVEKKEEKLLSEESVTKSQAEHVVTNAVNAAVEKVIDESSSSSSSVSQSNKVQNGFSINGLQTSHTSEAVTTNGHHYNAVSQSESVTEQFSEENIKVEEESTVKCSTTKLIVNSSNSNKHMEEEVHVRSDLEQVQSQFYKHGKESAEECVKKVYESTMSESASATNNSASVVTAIVTE